MPVIMFAVVFGLSMDYEVFLVSRVREQWLRTRRRVRRGRRRDRAHRPGDHRRRRDHGLRLPLVHPRRRAHAQGVRLRARGRRLPRRARRALRAAARRARAARAQRPGACRAGSTPGCPTSTSRARRTRRRSSTGSPSKPRAAERGRWPVRTEARLSGLWETRSLVRRTLMFGRAQRLTVRVMFLPQIVAAVFNLNGRPHYLHAGWFLISVANLIVIVADDRRVRARARRCPFPRGRDEET